MVSSSQRLVLLWRRFATLSRLWYCSTDFNKEQIDDLKEASEEYEQRQAERMSENQSTDWFVNQPVAVGSRPRRHVWQERKLLNYTSLPEHQAMCQKWSHRLHPPSLLFWSIIICASPSVDLRVLTSFSGLGRYLEPISRVHCRVAWRFEISLLTERADGWVALRA
jgi:hypothetical protein